MDMNLGLITRGAENSCKLRAYRMAEAHVRDHAVAKKSGDAVARAIVKLVGNQKFERLQLFLQRAHRADGNNSLNAKLLHGVNVGAVVNLRRCQAVAARVPSEEGHAHSFERSDDQGVRRISERRLDPNFARL